MKKIALAIAALALASAASAVNFSEVYATSEGRVFSLKGVRSFSCTTAAIYLTYQNGGGGFFPDTGSGCTKLKANPRFLNAGAKHIDPGLARTAVYLNNVTTMHWDNSGPEDIADIGGATFAAIKAGGN